MYNLMYYQTSIIRTILIPKKIVSIYNSSVFLKCTLVIKGDDTLIIIQYTVKPV